MSLIYLLVLTILFMCTDNLFSVSYNSNLIKYINEQYNIGCIKDTTIEYETINLDTFKFGYKKIGDINKDNIVDSIFILPALNECENGQSYYFTDMNIPRLNTESNCCLLNNIFLVDDIDEDGYLEVGLMESSCVSRYKKLSLYSLKNDKWLEFGRCTFDIDYNDFDADGYIGIEKLIQKISKNNFRMNEKTDLDRETKDIGKDYWLYFQMNK